ncbi:MAG: adenosylcobinamide amidohydrolase [Dehalococcoidia bacterium]|nr:adenosylcobinamide amidohydrolase [Dehalococcoidia bacterium]
MTGSRDGGVPGVTWEVAEGWLRIDSERPLRVIATAPANGGMSTTRHFLSIAAPANLDCDAPERAIGEVARTLGIDDPYVGFMTAVDLRNAVSATATDGERHVTVVATVGVTNATRPGEARFDGTAPGTVNIVVIVDGDLPPVALAELLALTAETKALTLIEAGATVADGRPASGTSTDAYAIACTGEGSLERYAGAVSAVGYLVGRAVREALSAGLPAALARTAEARR